MKTRVWLILTVMIILIACVALADVGPDWMASGEDAESQIGTITEKIFNGIVMFAAAMGAIALAWGLVEYHGIIGEKDSGVKRIKGGIIGIAAAGIIYAVVTFFASA